MTAPAGAKGIAHGTLGPDGVEVADVAQANRLHNKSMAGTPTRANGLRLLHAEAAYAMAQGWLAVAGAGPSGALSWQDVVAAGGPRAAVRFLVYRDLRERGLVARAAAAGAGAGDRWDVWPRGAPQGKPAYQVQACTAQDPLPAQELLPWAAAERVAAVLDEDGTVTHYRMQQASPQGSVPPVAVPAAPARALGGGALVTEPDAVAALRAQWLGTAVGDAQLLSGLEARSLRNARQLHLEDADLRALGPAPAPAVQAAHEALRAAGVVTRSGLRFGTHLRAYGGDPDAGHAPWLVQCADAGDHLAWVELARGVRLAHGVRKEFLVAVARGADVAFVRLAWFRP